MRGGVSSRTRSLQAVIASEAKQSRISPRKDSGLLRRARNDGGNSAALSLHPLPLWETGTRRGSGETGERFLSALESLDGTSLKQPLIRRFAPPSPTRGEGKKSHRRCFFSFGAGAGLRGAAGRRCWKPPGRCTP